MQFATLLLAGASAASAAVLPRDSSVTPAAAPQAFNVTGLNFAGTPHSVEAIYDLNVTRSDGSSGMVNCRTYTTTSPELSVFGQRSCSDPAWSFSFLPQNTSQGNGYSLEVTRAMAGQPHNETGCIFVDQSDIKLSKDPYNPNGDVYVLQFGPDFQITYNDNGMPCIWA